MLVLIGSKALKFYNRLQDREPADFDFITNDLNRVSKPGVEYSLATPSSTNEEILKYCVNFFTYWGETPYGHALIPPLSILKLLKLSCYKHLDKAKHEWDLKQLEDIQLDSYLVDLCNRRELEVMTRVEKQKTEFFDKYDVKRYIDHDLIHSYVAERPMYLNILTNAVDVSEEKFKHLSDEDKRRLVREECLVLSLERELIPKVKQAPFMVKSMVKEFKKTDTSDTVCLRWLSRLSIVNKVKGHPPWLSEWTNANIKYVLEGMNAWWSDRLDAMPVSFWEALLK